MIRFILVALTVVLFLILSIPLLLVLWVMDKFDSQKRQRISIRVIQGIFRFILKLAGVRITIEGLEQVPKDRAVLYVGNHRSYFDILLTYSRCKRLTGYIAKKEMERYLTLTRSEEHTSELQSPALNSYAVFCLKKKKVSSRNS